MTVINEDIKETPGLVQQRSPAVHWLARSAKFLSVASILTTILPALVSLGLGVFLLSIHTQSVMGVLLIAGFFALPIAGWYRIKRLHSVLDRLTEPVNAQLIPIQNLPPYNAGPTNEQVIGEVIGVEENQITSEFLGTGTVARPQNVIVFTTHRILFIYVPTLLGDTVVGSLDPGMIASTFARGSLESKYRELTQTMNLDQIIASYKSNSALNLSDLQGVRFGRIVSNISFLTKSRRRTFGVYVRSELNHAKQLVDQLGIQRY